MEQLFNRYGQALPKARDNDKGQPVAVVQSACRRCGGAGKSEAWKFTGYTCYDCGGNGRGPQRIERLYSQAQLDKLNAAQAKALATRVAKAKVLADAQAVADAAAREARKAKILADPVAQRLAQFAGRNDFVDDVAAKMAVRDISDAQRDAAMAACDRLEARDKLAASSEWLGAEGDKISFDGNVIFSKCVYDGAGYYDPSRYMAKIETPAGIVVWFGNRELAVGEAVKATSARVKKLDCYQGVKSTVIKNPRWA